MRASRESGPKRGTGPWGFGFARWKLDAQGQYSRQIGWKLNRNGKRGQHKFRLGSDLKEAQRREGCLAALWQQIASREGPAARWDEHTLEIGAQIARGQQPVCLPCRPAETHQAYADRLLRLQASFPTVPLVPADAEAYARGKEALAAAPREILPWDDSLPDLSKLPVVQLSWSRHRELSPMTSRIGLHQAFDDYVAWIRQAYHDEHRGRITANGHNKIKQVGILKERHADLPLSSLGYNEVEQMFLYWKKRPFKKGTQQPISRKSATNLMGELQRFFRWLHRSPKHRWRKPDDFDDLDLRVESHDSDYRRQGGGVSTFSLDELILLNQYATPLERALLLLALNCGFGIAEVATLLPAEVQLRQPLEPSLQESFGFASTDRDSFVRRVRRKNRVPGFFLLFPQTVQALEWALERRQRHASAVSDMPLLLNETGQPYDKPTTRGNANQQIPNRFRDLLQRIRKNDNEIRQFSFNKLRKTAGNLIRRFADGETAGIFLCHGQPVTSDDLLDVYTHRPFSKVFEAIRKVEEYLLPFFEAAGPEPFKPGPQAYTQRKTIHRIVELKEQGKSVREIASSTGKSKTTIHRHLKRAIDNAGIEPANSTTKTRD